MNKEIARNMDDKLVLITLWQEAVETFRTQLRLSAQILTFLIIANVTLLGYAVSEKSAFVMLIGVIFPIILLFFLHGINKLVLPIIYTAINLEEKLNIEEKLRLSSNYILFINNTSEEHNKEIINSQNINEITDIKTQLSQNLTGMTKNIHIGFIWFSLILQLVLPVILVMYSGWNFF